MLNINGNYIHDIDEAIQVVKELQRAVIKGIDNTVCDFDRLKFSCHVYDILTRVNEELETLKIVYQPQESVRTLEFSDRELRTYLNNKEYCTEA